MNIIERRSRRAALRIPPSFLLMFIMACGSALPESPTEPTPRPDPCDQDERLEVGLELRDFVTGALLPGLRVSSCGAAWTTDESGVVLLQLPANALAEATVDGGDEYGTYRFALDLPTVDRWDEFAAQFGGRVVFPKAMLGTAVADGMLDGHDLARNPARGRLFVAIGPEPDGVTGSVEGAAASITSSHEAALAQTGPLSSELGTILGVSSGDVVFVNVEPGWTRLDVVGADGSPCSLLWTWRDVPPWELEIEADVSHVVGVHCSPN